MGREEPYPSALSKAVETKLVGYLGGIHSVLKQVSAEPEIDASSKSTNRQILLVGEHQEHSVP